jgi:indole-3-glycerol phosphate synthase
MGADCVLLIAAVLTPAELASFLEVCREVDIDALVEVHDEVELEVAMRAGATMVGVNQRDLVTFAVDQARAVRMAPLIPSHVVSVAESGVRGREDAVALREAGYDAILVGEHLVTASDPGAALTELCVE